MNRDAKQIEGLDPVKVRIIREVIPEILRVEFSETEIGKIKTEAIINGRVKMSTKDHFSPFSAEFLVDNESPRVSRDFFGLMHLPANGIRINIKEDPKTRECTYELRSIYKEERHYTETHSRYVGHVRAGQEISPYSYAAQDYDEYEDYEVPKTGFFDANENVDRNLKDMETFNRVYGLLKYSSVKGAQELCKYLAKKFPKEAKVAEESLALKFQVIAKAERERLAALENLVGNGPISLAANA